MLVLWLLVYIIVCKKQYHFQTPAVLKIVGE